MRIPSFQEVLDTHQSVPLNNNMSVAEHLQKVRDDFRSANAGRSMGAQSALEFVVAQLPYLPATEQAAVAQELLDTTDRTVRWPGKPPTSADTRQRQERVLEALTRFVQETRGETLGVKDLARSLDLFMAKPTEVPYLALEGPFVNLGTEHLIITDCPAIAAHQPKPGEQTHTGWVTREVTSEGSKLAFTGLVPWNDGYKQIQVKLDAEKSEGPLSMVEHAAIQKLGTELAKRLGSQFVSPALFGSTGAVSARRFDQLRTLTNGDPIAVPPGEGKIDRMRIDGYPSGSSFTVGPACFYVSHGPGTGAPFPNRMGDGTSFQVCSVNDLHTLQVQIPLARDRGTAFVSLPNQPSLEAARSQVSQVLALARQVFAPLDR